MSSGHAKVVVQNAYVSCGERDPSAGAHRFGALLAMAQQVVPEFDRWWAAWTDGDGEPLTLGGLSWLVDLHMFDGDGVPSSDADLWARLFRLVEVALLLGDLLWADERHHDDATEVGAFAGAGVVCDVTRTRESLDQLLPWMGPTTVTTARAEVAAHSTSRGFAVDDVDWSRAGTHFVPIDADPADLAPPPCET